MIVVATLGVGRKTIRKDIGNISRTMFYDFKTNRGVIKESSEVIPHTLCVSSERWLWGGSF